MPTRRALVLALMIGALGIGLRLAIPVAPVDESYRDVVRYYRALERPAGTSNGPETSMP